MADAVGRGAKQLHLGALSEESRAAADARGWGWVWGGTGGARCDHI